MLFAVNLLVAVSMCCSQWKILIAQERIHWWYERACAHLAGWGCLLSMDVWTEKEAAMPRSLFGWCFIDRFPGCKVVLPGSYSTFLSFFGCPIHFEPYSLSLCWVDTASFSQPQHRFLALYAFVLFHATFPILLKLCFRWFLILLLLHSYSFLFPLWQRVSEWKTN